MVNVYINIEVE